MKKTNEELVRELSRVSIELENERNRRIQAENNIVKLEEKFSTHWEFLYKVIDTNPNYICVRDADGKYVLANESAAAFHGVTPQDMIGKTDIDLGIEDEEIVRLKEEDSQVMYHCANINYEEKLKDSCDNCMCWHTVKVPITSIDGDSNQVLIVGTDITRYKKAQRALEEERDNAQKYFNVTEAMMVVINKEEEVVRVNGKSCDVLECKEGDVLGKNFFDNFVPESSRLAVKQAFKDFINGEVDNLEHLECTVVTNGGVEKVIELHTGAIRDESGEVIACICSGQDVTQRKEIDRMKSDLINTVSHEIRTPLASILGFTELLLKRELKKEKMEKYLNTMHKETMRLTYLINNFLDIQRMESGEQVFEKDSFNIDEVIQDILDVYIIDKTHRFIVKKGEDKYPVHGDLNRIKQLLTNIVSNAKKYSPENGDITIELVNRENKYEIAVTDNGLGIPKEALPKLFTKFYRVDNSDHRKIGGTGLGLVICKEIVEAHGGEIWIDSDLGVGTKVSFTIPKEEGERSDTFKEMEDYILIVEDDVSLAQLIAENIQYTNLKYKIVTNGEKAIELIGNNPPVILILDIKLAGELDGWGVLDVVREKGLITKMPVIISSAIDKPIKETNKEAYDAYFVKPYSFEKLNQTIVNFLDYSKSEPNGNEVGIVIQAELENTENIIKKLSEKGFAL